MAARVWLLMKFEISARRLAGPVSLLDATVWRNRRSVGYGQVRSGAGCREAPPPARTPPRLLSWSHRWSGIGCPYAGSATGNRHADGRTYPSVGTVARGAGREAEPSYAICGRRTDPSARPALSPPPPPPGAGPPAGPPPRPPPPAAPGPPRGGGGGGPPPGARRAIRRRRTPAPLGV